MVCFGNGISLNLEKDAFLTSSFFSQVEEEEETRVLVRTLILEFKESEGVE